jgi:hypothetical protein
MPGGRKQKYKYRSREFLEMIEGLAKKGLTDREIALSIGLNPTFFCEKKSEVAELSEVLTRARSQINAIVRQKYLAIGIGGIKIKTVTRRKYEDEGDKKFPDAEIIQETETELPPNPNVLQTWLFHHDKEWNEAVMQGKRLDVTSNGSNVGTQLIFSPTPLSPKDIEDIKNLQSGKDSTDTGLSET